MHLAPDLHTFADREELAQHLAGVIAGHLRRQLETGEQPCLVVSGGSTPVPLFSQLSQENLPWERITVTLADERWVANTDPDSNERLVRTLLLQNHAARASFIPLKNKAPSALQGEDECDRRITAITRPFTVVILGMGSDGHTASLFPGASRLSHALDLQSGRNCLAISPPEARHERMTLTLPCLLDTNLIILHITGQKKREVLEQALTEGPLKAMPVRSILRQQQTPVHVYWAP